MTQMMQGPAGYDEIGHRGKHKRSMGCDVPPLCTEVKQMMQGPGGHIGILHKGQHEWIHGCDINPKCTEVGRQMIASPGSAIDSPHLEGAGCAARGCTPAEQPVRRQMLGMLGAPPPHNRRHPEGPGCTAGTGSSHCTPVQADDAPKGPGDSTPSHYQGAGMTPFDVIDAFELDFYEANALKYLLRWRKKNGVEDLKKARHYVDILVKRAEEK